MDNKTIREYNKERGHFLENSDKDNFQIQKESIRIPFFNYNQRKLPQKSHVISVQQPPHNQQVNRKRKQLLTRLTLDRKVYKQQVAVDGKESSNKNIQSELAYFFKTKSISPSMKSPSMKQTNKSVKKNITIKTRTQSMNKQSPQSQDNQDNDSQFLNIRSYKKDSQLPAIGIHKVRQKNRSDRKRKKKSKPSIQKLQKSKEQMVKKCYSIEISKLSDVLPIARKIKTQQQLENQFIIKKIVHVQPSPDLSRVRLKNRYQKLQEYKLIRQKKLNIFSPKEFLLNRSSKLHNRSQKKYIKL